jgi:hypothetical protein
MREYPYPELQRQAIAERNLPDSEKERVRLVDQVEAEFGKRYIRAQQFNLHADHEDAAPILEVGNRP